MSDLSRPTASARDSIVRWATSTTPHRSLAAPRLVAGMIFLASGTLKEAVHPAAANWSAMVTQLGVPLHAVVVEVAPLLEILVGALLLLGALTRLASLGALALMAGAAWIHLTVDSSKLPTGLPPTWLPVLTATLAAFIAWRGAGAWSVDMARSRRR